MSAVLPLFLKLEGRKVLLVGGGNVAVQKLRSLEGTGARIEAVSPAFRPELLDAHLTRHQRPFEPADLEGAWLVIAAATPEVNAEVSRLAEAQKIFVVAVDHPDVCSAYAGGVIRRGDVAVSISTNGRAPALAGLLREALDAVLPEDLDRWMEVADQARADWRARKVPMSERRPLLFAALERLYSKRSAA